MIKAPESRDCDIDLLKTRLQLRASLHENACELARTSKLYNDSVLAIIALGDSSSAEATQTLRDYADSAAKQAAISHTREILLLQKTIEVNWELRQRNLTEFHLGHPAVLAAFENDPNLPENLLEDRPDDGRVA